MNGLDKAQRAYDLQLPDERDVEDERMEIDAQVREMMTWPENDPFESSNLLEAMSECQMKETPEWKIAHAHFLNGDAQEFLLAVKNMVFNYWHGQLAAKIEREGSD